MTTRNADIIARKLAALGCAHAFGIPGGETLALRVFNLLHYGHHAQVNALCLILLLLAVLPLAAWAVFGLFKKKPAHD